LLSVKSGALKFTFEDSNIGIDVKQGQWLLVLAMSLVYASPIATLEAVEGLVSRRIRFRIRFWFLTPLVVVVSTSRK